MISRDAKYKIRFFKYLSQSHGLRGDGSIKNSAGSAVPVSLDTVISRISHGDHLVDAETEDDHDHRRTQ